MTALLDINVVLDFLLARSPWNADAAKIWDAHHQAVNSSRGYTDILFWKFLAFPFPKLSVEILTILENQISLGWGFGAVVSLEVAFLP
jgi:hypothetical protein